MEGEIVNKVAQAGIEQIDLGDFVSKNELIGIDLKERLWNELVLREKDFRTWVKEHDWTNYNNKNVYIYCSNDAIIPSWAYMLVVTQLTDASAVFYGDLEVAREELFFKNLTQWNIDHLLDKRVMVKGCSSIPNPNKAFVVLTERLLPVVKNLMFGEPCSAVPVYKKKK